MKKYKIGNALWSFNPEKDMFESIESAWIYLSDAFARARTADAGRSFKVFMWVMEENEYGFTDWIMCKEGFAQHIS